MKIIDLFDYTYLKLKNEKYLLIKAPLNQDRSVIVEIFAECALKLVNLRKAIGAEVPVLDLFYEYRCRPMHEFELVNEEEYEYYISEFEDIKVQNESI